jgi:hypothetical protein
MVGVQKEVGNRSDPDLKERYRSRTWNQSVVDEVGQCNHVRSECETIHP